MTRTEAIEGGRHIRRAILKLADNQSLGETEAAAAMADVMEGLATPAQIAGFITALRMKGETVDEITGCAKAMRAKAKTIRPCVDLLVDTCGTGGDQASTFNISTTTAFVVAGAGLPVAKHGNRSVSSRCGSADVLEALGVRIDLTPEQVTTCIELTGIGFLYAPAFHLAMKHAIGPRRELGIRTVFNMLGPLTNPANAQVQVLGVYSPELTQPLAEVLRRLGVREAFVVHGLDRLDEISIAGPTRVSHLRNGEVHTVQIRPDDVGIAIADHKAIQGGDAALNAQIMLQVLQGEKGPYRDVVLLNAAATLYVGGAAGRLCDGVRLAADVIDTGKAMRKLNALREFTSAVVA